MDVERQISNLLLVHFSESFRKNTLLFKKMIPANLHKNFYLGEITVLLSNNFLIEKLLITFEMISILEIFFDTNS